MAIKTVRECDYCQEQATADMTKPGKLPAGWQVVIITVTNADGNDVLNKSIEICDKHLGDSVGTIIGVCIND